MVKLKNANDKYHKSHISVKKRLKVVFNSALYVPHFYTRQRLYIKQLNERDEALTLFLRANYPYGTTFTRHDIESMLPEVNLLLDVKIKRDDLSRQILRLKRHQVIVSVRNRIYALKD